jgi:hypothetical protein
MTAACGFIIAFYIKGFFNFETSGKRMLWHWYIFEFTLIPQDTYFKIYCRYF